MSTTRMARGLLGIRKVLSLSSRPGSRPVVCVVMKPSGQVRHFYRGRDSPFAQMEEFMKDMERKFRRDVENIFRDTGMARVPEARSKPRFGEVEDISTPETYKLSFNFLSADPQNVKVSLKGRTLTVAGSAEEITAMSRSSRQVSVEYEIPEGINIDALESGLSQDGILTIEAPRIHPEGPTPIHIQRE